MSLGINEICHEVDSVDNDLAAVTTAQGEAERALAEWQSQLEAAQRVLQESAGVRARCTTQIRQLLEQVDPFLAEAISDVAAAGNAARDFFLQGRMELRNETATVAGTLMQWAAKNANLQAEDNYIGEQLSNQFDQMRTIHVEQRADLQTASTERERIAAEMEAARSQVARGIEQAGQHLQKEIRGEINRLEAGATGLRDTLRQLSQGTTQHLFSLSGEVVPASLNRIGDSLRTQLQSNVQGIVGDGIRTVAEGIAVGGKEFDRRRHSSHSRLDATPGIVASLNPIVEPARALTEMVDDLVRQLPIPL